MESRHAASVFRPSFAPVISLAESLVSHIPCNSTLRWPRGSDITIAGGSGTVAWRLVASYESYEEAQRTVDRLSDASFPVENVEIVGRDLPLVERVTGRLTTGGAALAGAGSGAWFGLFIGLLVGLFTTGPEWLGLVLGGLAIGAAWGAVFASPRSWQPADSATSRRCAPSPQDTTT
jgi:hypothetical protein